MMASVEEYEFQFRVMSEPMITVKPRVNRLDPAFEENNIDQTHSGKKNQRKIGMCNYQVPWRKQDDMRQYPGAVRMQNFQNHICFLSNHTLPRSLHQDFANQFPLDQMV